MKLEDEKAASLESWRWTEEMEEKMATPRCGLTRTDEEVKYCQTWKILPDVEIVPGEVGTWYRYKLDLPHKLPNQIPLPI